MKKVLLTGATGFIGRHCLASLSELGYEVHAITVDVPLEGSSGIHWHKVDLLDSAQLSALICGVRPTHLLHFAWYTAPGKYWTSAENLHWLQASLELLRGFVSCGGQRVVMAGTCAEYDWRYGYCSEQVTPLLPATLYGVCKHSLQIMLDAFARQTGLSAAWGRIFFLYGPREHPDRLVPSVILTLLRDEPARCSHGNQIRDYLFVQDVSDALVTLLESDVSGPVNIASGIPIALKDIICRIAERLNRRDLIQLGALPTPANEPPLVVADVSRLHDEVGWRPKYDLDTGLNRTIEWWKKQLGVTNQEGK